MDFNHFLENNAQNDKIENIVVGAIITNKNGEIFLAKRKKKSFMGEFYELPGGKAKKDENIYDTLVRGVKQETNMEITKINSYVDQFDYLSGSCKKCRQLNFKVEVNLKDKILLTEHESYKWIKLEDIEKENIISPEVKKGLLIYVYNEFQKNN